MLLVLVLLEAFTITGLVVAECDTMVGAVAVAAAVAAAAAIFWISNIQSAAVSPPVVLVSRLSLPNRSDSGRG
jgi:hypothetical protein